MFIGKKKVEEKQKQMNAMKRYNKICMSTILTRSNYRQGLNLLHDFRTIAYKLAAHRSSLFQTKGNKKFSDSHHNVTKFQKCLVIAGNWSLIGRIEGLMPTRDQLTQAKLSFIVQTILITTEFN
jgi:hypothetical protein